MNTVKVFKQIWYDSDSMVELNSYIVYKSEDNIRLVGSNWIEELREKNNKYYYVIDQGNCPDLRLVDTSVYPFGIVSAFISGRYKINKNTACVSELPKLRNYPKPAICTEYVLPKEFDYQTVWRMVIDAKYYKTDNQQIDFIGYQGYVQNILIGYINEELFSIILKSKYSDIMYVRIL